MAILEVKRLKISFRTNNGAVKAVRDISFKLEKGKTLAIVGESGSGKSVTSKAILGISAGNVIIESGEIIYDGKDLLRSSEQDMYHVRGDKIGMIFQDPLSSLNPIVRIGHQITESMLLKNKAIRKEAKKDLKAMLNNLKIAMYEAKAESSHDKAVIDQLLADLNGANLKASMLENSFNESLGFAGDISSAIKDLLIKLEHRYLGDPSSQIKIMLRKQKRIKDSYFVYGIEKELQTVEETLTELLATYKGWKALKTEEKQSRIPAIIENFTKVEKIVDTIIDREEIDFFHLGFYVNKNDKADLSSLPFAEINAKTKQFIDETFIPTFTAYNRAALEHSVYKTLDFKREVVTLVEAFKKSLQEEELDKKVFKARIKQLTA